MHLATKQTFLGVNTDFMMELPIFSMFDVTCMSLNTRPIQRRHGVFIVVGGPSPSYLLAKLELTQLGSKLRSLPNTAWVATADRCAIDATYCCQLLPLEPFWTPKKNATDSTNWKVCGKVFYATMGPEKIWSDTYRRDVSWWQTLTCLIPDTLNGFRVGTWSDVVWILIERPVTVCNVLDARQLYLD